jgi:predicted DNA-binding transcriptional regulator AlpA
MSGKECVDIGPPRKKRKSSTKLVQTSIEKSRPGVKMQPAPMQHAAAADGRKDNFMLLNIFQTAQKCDCDPNTIKDWTAYGLMPAPLVVGLSLRWRESDLQSWVENGCPKMSVPSETELDHLWQVLDAELTGNLPQQFDNELAEIERTRKD